MLIRLKKFFLSNVCFSSVFSWFPVAISALIFIGIFYYSPALVTSVDLIHSTFRPWKKFLVLFVWTTLFFGWLSWFPFWVRVIFSVLIFTPSAFFLFVAFSFKLPYESYSLVADIAETNWIEALSFVDFWGIAFLKIFLVAILFFSFFLGKFRPRFPSKIFIRIGVPAILVAACFSKQFLGSIAPVNRIVTPYRNFLVHKGQTGQVFSAIFKIENGISREDCVVVREKDAPVVFLHIGESVRADHAPFNGYARETMPRVNKEFAAGNVVSFPKCVSFPKHTQHSVPGILTPATVLDPVIRHCSFIPFLNVAGIETFAFFSKMSAAGGDSSDSSLRVLTRKIAHPYFSAGTSDTLFPRVNETLAKLDGNAFVLYYGEGAHVPSTHYNREKYSVFTPDATRNVEDFRHINSYDNSIVATDDFVGNALDALRDKNAVYIYVADHGEMLGEDGLWCRPDSSFRRKETRHVLFFIWASKKFQTENAELWKNLRENGSRLKIVSHDFIYHSVLELCGIRNAFFDARYDIFSPAAEAFPQEIPDAEKFPGLRFESAPVGKTTEISPKIRREK